MSAQVLLASSARGAALLAAALDAGCLGPAGRRVLVLAEGAAAPGLGDLLGARVDAVVPWREALGAGEWSPRADDVPLWERYLRLAWGLREERVALAVESVETGPGLALAQVFVDAPLTVYAADARAYGPTRGKLDPLIGTRVERLLHLDLVPGLAPLLLSEFGVGAEAVPAKAYTGVLAEMAEAADDVPSTEGAVLLLGDGSDEALYPRMPAEVAALGHTRAVLAPHDGTPAPSAAAPGLTLTVAAPTALPEVLFARSRPALVVGRSSPALLTAAALYGLPVARTGTGALLERLTPYEHPDRVPLTLLDALLPDLAGGARPDVDVAALVRAVGFVARPRVLPELRPAAEAYLRATPAAARYLPRRRLAALGLPGGLPAGLAVLSHGAAARRVVRRARAVGRSLGR
ncbi:hypothetical protein [Streptomyces sp. NPDC003717]|uniref:hypothetical protein n=1 Tax=Streptomyces sp. NPDC003717 TaxID=3154276 RepID=UPI0033B42662